MTANEKNNRKKIRISIIDVLIVITLIACIAGGFMHYKVYEKNNEVVTSDVCSVSVMLSEVENDVSAKIKAGDVVYFKDNDTVFGTITEVSEKDADYYYTNEQGVRVKGSNIYAKNVSVVIEVNGEMTKNGFLANGLEYVAAGMELELYSAEFWEKALIFDVQQLSE